jgi:pyruvate dehydrogenase E1 component alpha subunit
VNFHQQGIDVAKRADGFGMPGVVVDGHDFFAVHEAAGEAIERARNGGGPSLLECKVNRYYGHFEGDAQTYRGPGEVDEIRRTRDCLAGFSRQVTEAGMLQADDLSQIDEEVRRLIDEAVKTAKASPVPDPARDLLTDVYVSY